ncbi:cathelicidin-4 [Bombina bombina]|uniref:cathelicidin-4 n=1 Tax=Bombina bombina TaxID=8345 RepID=UPI00235A9BAA|nr:cathelicidin-4 [Bombina bombina]
MVLCVALLLSLLSASVLTAPLSESRPLPKSLAQSAVDTFNLENTGTQKLFRLLQLKNVKKKTFDWGVHFTIGFTVRETQCQKNAGHNVQQCKYKNKGQTLVCSVEVSVLDMAQDNPLSSVECHPPAKQLKKTNPKQPEDQADVPVIRLIHYGKYSTAALMHRSEDIAEETH